MPADLLSRETPFLEGYDRLRETLTHLGPEWVEGLREENRERFARAGLPGAGEEAWRFTRLKALEKTAFRFAGASAPVLDAVPTPASGDTPCQRLVFVNGVFAPQHSNTSREGCPEALSLEEVLRDRPGILDGRLGAAADTAVHRFAALNTAFLREGAVVRVPAGTWAGLVQLVFVSIAGAAPRAIYPRVLVVLEDGAEALLVEEYLRADRDPRTGGPVLVAPVSEIFLGRNSGLEHLRIVRDRDDGIHLGLAAVRQDRDSRYTNHALALGGKLIRLDLDLRMAGEGSEAVLNGLYLTRGREHVDHHLRVDHAAPHTRSRQLYKGVLDGKSTAVFNGRVVIRPDAQKVDAGQINRNLLLSANALVNTNPELEIFADDVKAQHGATVGQIEDEPLFYLRSRGIPVSEARTLLIESFAGEMVEPIPVPAVREFLREELVRRFETASGGLAGDPMP